MSFPVPDEPLRRRGGGAMIRVRTVVANGILGCAACLALMATVACAHLQTASVTDVEKATQQWIAAFNHHSPQDIVSLYAEDAVFFGTSSPVLRDTPELVRDYFKNNATSSSTIVMGDHRVQIFGDVAVNTGFYTFHTPPPAESGKTVERLARFTFVYQRRAGRWMIVEHHSSASPK